MLVSGRVGLFSLSKSPYNWVTRVISPLEVELFHPTSKDPSYTLNIPMKLLVWGPKFGEEVFRKPCDVFQERSVGSPGMMCFPAK